MLKTEFITLMNSSIGHGHECYTDLNKRDWRHTTSLQLIQQYFFCNTVVTEIRTLFNLSEGMLIQFISKIWYISSFTWYSNIISHVAFYSFLCVVCSRTATIYKYIWKIFTYLQWPLTALLD